MRALGFGWHRKAVNSILHGKRQVKVDELVALAVALETTVLMLLLPAGPLDVMNFDVEFEIGIMEPLLAPQYRDLIRQTHERDARPRVRIDGFSDGDPPDEAPNWISTEVWLKRQILRLARAEYAAAHPDADLESVSDSDVRAFALGQIEEETIT